jgi:hypothetical protein
MNGHLCPLPKLQLLFTIYKPNQIVAAIVYTIKSLYVLVADFWKVVF